MRKKQRRSNVFAASTITITIILGKTRPACAFTAIRFSAPYVPTGIVSGVQKEQQLHRNVQHRGAGSKWTWTADTGSHPASAWWSPPRDVGQQNRLISM